MDAMTISPTKPTMTPRQFIERWQDAGFGERQAAHTWFLDVLRLVGHPDHVEVNDRDNFTFEKPVPGGFADVYLAGRFGWEFKGSEAQLPNAFNQLLRYQVYLKTPPLLIVSSFQLIRVQTNFPGRETEVHEIPIWELDRQAQFDKLRNIFFAPEEFEPGRTVEEVTRETARLFGTIVEDMESHSDDSEQLARYLNQIVFCLYAEDTGLLPEEVFTGITRQHFKNPAYFNAATRELFAKMRDGGLFGADVVPRFNGDLFAESDTVELSEVALFRLVEAVRKNWRDIEPSIFGTLFEGALDASKRAQLGAHYTSADDIMLVVEPVVMTPLRREWAEIKKRVDTLAADGERQDAIAALYGFRKRLSEVTVLDPACGSGNFLYVALKSLLDLEKEVIDRAEDFGAGGLAPMVNPSQMRGIEKDYYAAELARTALWIGYIQWHQINGFAYTRNPILMPLDTIRQADAILDPSDPDDPREAEWPDAEFIIGNPPFLGRGQLRSTLGDDYTNRLYTIYGDRLPNSSDLCCYWLEKARALIEDGRTTRAGLLATQGIRGKANRTVLQRIKASGDIFLTYPDQDWLLSGATVHISIVGFDNGAETQRIFEGKLTNNQINADLTTGVDTTRAHILAENSGISFEGPSPKAPFDITGSQAKTMLTEPLNVNGKSNEDVVRPVYNGRDLVDNPRGKFTIDFGTLSVDDACQYELPFEYVKQVVYPKRQQKSQASFRKRWWQYARPRSEMRQALEGLGRFIATPRVSKHRVFVWVNPDILCNDATDVFAREDDYAFGVLHSTIHEIWARRMGTQVRDAKSGFRYTPTTCFETFPFPRATDGQRDAISDAARELNRLRENWLNPTDSDGNPALDGDALRRRTLTNLYNARPTWLANAHSRLDSAVADAYGWEDELTDPQILERLLVLNLERYEEERAG